jgi:hypothetical protein
VTGIENETHVKESIMPICFSTQAANADKMNDDADGAARGMPNALGAHGARNRTQRNPEVEDTNEARPGKDINAPGFVKDRDSTK